VNRFTGGTTESDFCDGHHMRVETPRRSRYRSGRSSRTRPRPLRGIGDYGVVHMPLDGDIQVYGDD
jgi:hypothetical protein